MPEWMQVDLPVLPPVGILSYLSAKSLQDLAVYGKYERFQPGENLIEEGTPQHRLYIVVEGTMQISAMVSGQEIVYCQIEPGECLGEVSLFEEGPASATVRAITVSVLWSMDINEMITYLSEHVGGGGALLMGIARCLSQRLRQANQTIARHHLNDVTPIHQNRSEPIRAEVVDAPSNFFDKLQKKFGSDGKKPKIPTEIKL